MLKTMGNRLGSCEEEVEMVFSMYPKIIFL